MANIPTKNEDYVKLTDKQKEYLPFFVMLDLMQESGQMNMFGAPAKLRELDSDLSRHESIAIASEWMKSKTVNNNERK
jgi:hypothetical protein